MNNNNLIANYLDIIGVTYTQKYTNEFSKHPYNNNLYGIYDFLSNYKLDLKAYRVAHLSNISEECFPFITLLNYEFVIVKKFNEGSVYYLKNGELHSIRVADFESVWSHSILCGKKVKVTKEPNYKKNKTQECKDFFFRMILLFSVVFLILGAILLSHDDQNWVTYTTLAFSVMGISVCYALILEATNSENKKITRLCGLIRNGDCKKVAESKGSVFLGFFKLCEIGSAFFISNLLWIAFYPDAIQTLFVFSLFGTLMSIWSVLYQYLIVKKWCILCLTVFGIIWLQILTLLIGIHYEAIIFNWSIREITTIFLIGFTYYLIAYTIHFAVDMIKKVKYHTILERKYDRLRFNSGVFKLLNNAMHEINPNELCTRISFGKKDSQNIITVFSNPFCGPCANMHKTLLDFINRDCRIDYIFGYFDKERSEVNKYILSSYEIYGPSKTWNILSEWYNQSNKHVSFFEKYSHLDPSSAWVSEEFENHKQWITESKLYSTPTILFNNHLLSSTYELEDLLYIINRLD